MSVYDALEDSVLENAIAAYNPQTTENKFGDYSLTKGWFLKKKLLGGHDSHKAVDLCWVYPTKVSTKAYGVVTTAVNWSMTMHFRPDKTVSFYYEHSDIKDKLPTANVEYKLNLLRQVVPWAISGFSEYRAECWKKQRDVFLKLVDERLEAVRIALGSGGLVVETDGNLTARNPVNLPILVFSFLKNEKGKVTGRKYDSSKEVTGQASTAYYKA